MLGLVIAMFGGGFIGLCVGVYLVAERTLATRNGCAVCGRLWDHMHNDMQRTSLVRVIDSQTARPYDQDTDVPTQGDTE